jgi:trehalose 6-phosphate synthase/phosphatase
MERTIADRYAKSSHSLFLLDYDGTLANFKARPKDARLTEVQYKTLQTLCQNPRNTVVIISGRDRHTLDDWLADLPINLAAEYGHLVKEQGMPWEVQAGRDESWKHAVRPIFQGLVDAVPGSFIEDKEFSIVWHYWGIDDAIAEQSMQKVLIPLNDIAYEFRLAIKPSTKVLEVTVPGVDKSAIAEHWLQRRDWDFVLAAGDDKADEVLFKAMPESVFTIKIGSGRSAARYRLPNPKALSELIERLNTAD